jgi:hypothetical protein
LEYALRKVQKHQLRLKLNGIYQLLAYSENMNPLGDNINTMKIGTETLTEAHKEICLAVKAERTKHMLLPCDRNAGQNHGIKMANRSFENVVGFKYLGRTVKIRILIQVEIKR